MVALHRDVESNLPPETSVFRVFPSAMHYNIHNYSTISYAYAARCDLPLLWIDAMPIWFLRLAELLASSKMLSPNFTFWWMNPELVTWRNERLQHESILRQMHAGLEEYKRQTGVLADIFVDTVSLLHGSPPGSLLKSIRPHELATNKVTRYNVKKTLWVEASSI
ncbi:unnamed protein product [Phytophthora lilii]|uniref:Unnamed protein product n=1 Tax=Phytophthora lilii TaxID=2077276 RepID=A0A9W6WFE3_9STRA|nr:unnamed protein product [Phytophthora lilii]